MLINHCFQTHRTHLQMCSANISMTTIGNLLNLFRAYIVKRCINGIQINRVSSSSNMPESLYKSLTARSVALDEKDLSGTCVWWHSYDPMTVRVPIETDTGLRSSININDFHLSDMLVDCGDFEMISAFYHERNYWLDTRSLNIELKFLYTWRSSWQNEHPNKMFVIKSLSIF